MTSALILGGGVAGLAAAYRLLQLKPDWQVTVLEGDYRLGGLAAGWRNNEFAADLGPHRIYTELPEIEALLPELIAKDQMITVQRRSELLLDGHFYRYPVRAGELLRQMGPFQMGRFGFSAVAGKLLGMTREPRNYEDAMIASFGRGVYERIVQPYTRKVWKIEPSGLSEEVARVRVSAGNTNRLVKQLLGKAEGKKGTQSALNSFSYIKGGVEGLVTSLAGKVTDRSGKLETDQRVLGFEWDGARLTGAHIEDISSQTKVLRQADGFISTLPITDLVAMLQKLSADSAAAKAADGLVYVGLILVALVIRRPQFTPNSWIYFPETQYVFNRSYEPGNFDPSMRPSDRSLSVFEVTARWDEPLWTMPDDELIARVKADAVKTGLVTDADIENAFLVRVPYTYPLYTVDYRDRLEVIFQYLRRFPNLLSTGRQGLFNHNNMDHSMLMGMRAAESLGRGDDDAAQGWYSNLNQFAHFRIVD